MVTGKTWSAFSERCGISGNIYLENKLYTPNKIPNIKLFEYNYCWEFENSKRKYILTWIVFEWKVILPTLNTWYANNIGKVRVHTNEFNWILDLFFSFRFYFLSKTYTYINRIESLDWKKKNIRFCGLFYNVFLFASLKVYL